MKKLLITTALLMLSVCGFAGAEKGLSISKSDSKKLSSILDAQPEDVKARYKYRNPKETLSFFGIKPGMTVVEALPGRGWYSKILMPYLGEKGHLVGVDYQASLWSNFDWAKDEWISKRKEWPKTWPSDANGWVEGKKSKVSAYTFGTFPKEMNGKADAVLFVRALHNLVNFNEKGNYLNQAIEDSYRILKPGGIVGIVQHSVDDPKSTGKSGYLHKKYVIKKMKKAGFEYVGESNINENAKDKPVGEETVWRLPPSLAGSKDNKELAEKYKAIGESNRMTLAFRKPKA